MQTPGYASEPRMLSSSNDSQTFINGWEPLCIKSNANLKNHINIHFPDIPKNLSIDMSDKQKLSIKPQKKERVHSSQKLINQSKITRESKMGQLFVVLFQTAWIRLLFSPIYFWNIVL